MKKQEKQKLELKKINIAKIDNLAQKKILGGVEGVFTVVDQGTSYIL